MPQDWRNVAALNLGHFVDCTFLLIVLFCYCTVRLTEVCECQRAGW
jgi:hypothetical protein